VQYEFTVENVADRSLKANNNIVTMAFSTTNGDLVTLNMDITFASTLIDHLATLNNEAIAAWMKTGGYNRCQNVSVNIDPTHTLLLVDFDPGHPYRVGVALPINRAEEFADMILECARSAQHLDQKQTRQ